jgi:hypothetical protein
MSGGSLTPEALAGAIKLAEEEGFEVVRGNDATLLLDLDTEHAVEQFYRVLPIVEEHFGVESHETWSSKSGKTHAAVKLTAPLPCVQRLLLQAALGSDGKREALGLLQLQNGCAEPNVLFKPTAKSTTTIDADFEEL